MNHFWFTKFENWKNFNSLTIFLLDRLCIFTLNWQITLRHKNKQLYFTSNVKLTNFPLLLPVILSSTKVQRKLPLSTIGISLRKPDFERAAENNEKSEKWSFTHLIFLAWFVDVLRFQLFRLYFNPNHDMGNNWIFDHLQDWFEKFYNLWAVMRIKYIII